MIRCVQFRCFLVVFLVSAQVLGATQTLIHPDWDNDVEVLPDAPSLRDSGNLLWHNGNRALVGRSPMALQLVQERVATTSHVIVNFRARTLLADELRTSPRTRVFFPGTPDEPGFALVVINSVADLDDLALRAHDEGFVCGQLEAMNGLPLVSSVTHTAPIYGEWAALSAVKSQLALVNTTTLKAVVKTFSDQFTTRGHTVAQTSQQVHEYIKELMEEQINSKVTVSYLYGTLSNISSQQQNVVAVLEGTKDVKTTVIVGAHMDTILGVKPDGANKGADDDASGIGTILEVMRVIAASGATYQRRVEFHAYAAEEVGLYGSSDLAGKYYSSGRKVAAMLQLDMDAYAQDPNSVRIYLVTNDTSEVLRESAKNLANTYLGGDIEELALKAGTSDHRSWNSNGYPAVFPFEHPLNYNKVLHTANDTMDNANNFALAARITKLVLAFVAHHAGLDGASSEYTTLKASAAPSADIKIAVMTPSDASQTDTWDIAVGTATTVAAIKTCSGSDATAFVCTGSLKTLVLDSSSGERNFFINAEGDSFSLTDPQVQGFYGYDSNNKLVAERVVILKRKS